MERIVDIGTARLPVTDGGEGRPVVLLHAGVADRSSWAGLISVMTGAPTQYRFLSYDRRGFGDATWEPEPHSPVSDLVAVLEACGADPVVLVGNSQGGRLAIDLALERPDLVEGLVLVGTAVSGAPAPNPEELARISLLGDAIDEAERDGDLNLVNELECQLWLDGPGSPSGRVAGEMRSQFLRMNARALRAPDVGETVWSTESWRRLEELVVATTVVVGDLDLPHIISRSEAMTRRIAGSTLMTLHGTAHLVAFEDPVGFSGLLAAFLARLTVGP